MRQILHLRLMRGRLARDAARSLVITCAVFAAMIGAPATADNTGAVLVTLSVESVGITVTGGTVTMSNGPHGSAVRVRAHPAGGTAAAPPTVTNSGNVAITYLDVTFDGASGQEASCDGGGGSWAAHASAAGVDQFVMRAWASTDPNQGTFHSNAIELVPGVGSGNVLAVSPLEPEAAVPLLLEVLTPVAALAGADGCSISLSVTAAVS